MRPPDRSPEGNGDANVLSVTTDRWRLEASVTGRGAAQALVGCLDAARAADRSSPACAAPPSNPPPNLPPDDA